MYLFDTNIFLEILLGQERAAVCERALGSLNEEKTCWVTSFSLHSIEAILSSRDGCEDVLQKFLRDFIGRSGLVHRYETTTEEEWQISELLKRVELDFDDTVQYYVARKKNLALVTLDRDFQKIRDIKVISPEDL